MSVYQYQDSSPIDKIAVRKTAGGGTRAYIFTQDNTGKTAEAIQAALSKAQMASVATEREGEPCLEVRGCRSFKTLENVLRPTGMLQGAATIDHSDNEKFSLRETLRHNMVTLYGVINVVADMGIIAYGHMKQKLSPSNDAWEEKASGYAYSAGSVMFTLFGRGDKSDFHARDLAAALKEELHKKGIELPDESAASSFVNARRKENGLKRMRSYLSKGGSDAGNIATGVAGGFIALGAFNNKNHAAPKERMIEGALGSITMLSGIGGAMITEKAPDRDNPPTTAWGKFKEWVHERPNRLPGFGYMVSTLAHGSEAIKGYKNADELYPGKGDYARKAYAMRGGFAGMNLLGETVLASASKGHGVGVHTNSGIAETAISIVADAIVRQPKEQRAALAHDLSCNFLANPAILGGDACDLEPKLMERVQRLEANPWLVNKSSQANTTSSGAPDEDTQKTPGKWVDATLARKEPVRTKPADFMASVDQRRANSQTLTPSH